MNRRNFLYSGLFSVFGSPVLGHIGKGTGWPLDERREQQQEPYSSVPPPGYEVPGMTRRYVFRTWQSHTSLLERSRSLSQMLGLGVVGLAQDRLRDAAVEAKIGELLPLIGDRIVAGKTGYLLRVNLVKATGGRLYPAPGLISALGAGTEPLDALAESYRRPTIGPTQPTLPMEYHYRWCTRSADTIEAACPDLELGRRLEVQARAEATRRQVLGSITAAETAQALARVERAKDWQAIASEHLRSIASQQDRERMETLTRQFAAAEQRFNNAYADFQRTQEEMAAHAREQAMLSTITTVLGALNTALQARGQLRGSPTESPEAAARWQEHQRSVLQFASDSARAEMNLGAPVLRQLDIRLKQEWDRRGVPTPQAEWRPPVHM